MAKNEINEEVRPITITDIDEHTGASLVYTLEFNRDSVKFAEARGFSIDKVSDAPMTYIPDFFFYAFRMHHKNVSREKTDKLFDKMGGMPEGMLERLGQLYAVPFEALTQSDSKPKNPNVTVEF